MYFWYFFKDLISIYSPSFLPLFMKGRNKKSFISYSIKNSLYVKERKYSWLIRGKYLWLKKESDKISKTTCIWARRLVEFKSNGCGNSPNPFMYGLNAWLSLKMLGLPAYQTHVCLGLVWRSSKMVLELSV